MADRKQKLLDFIIYINTLSPTERNIYMGKLNNTELNYISEIFSNFIKSNLKTDKTVFKKIVKLKKYIRNVASRNFSKSRKLRILKSTRGGYILQLLLPLAISALTILLK